MKQRTALPEPTLDRLFADARVAASRLAADAAPDFADVLARVRARAPQLVPAEAVLADAPAGGVVDIRSATRGSPEMEAALDDLFADARDVVVRKVDARRMVATPPLRRREPSRRAPVLAVAAALAAAVVLAVVGARMIGRFAPEAERAESIDQAMLMGSDRSDGSGEYELHDVERAADGPDPGPTPSPDRPEPGALEEVPPALPPTPARPPASPSDRAAQLRALADQAQALWRAGDAAGAERLLERIVRIGGRSVQVEMAFADLFVIAHQIHGAEARSARWNAYLRRFPRGRFADDARAGLCRGADPAKRSICWHDYLADFPKGSYRAEASRTIERNP